MAAHAVERQLPLGDISAALRQLILVPPRAREVAP
jgi:hypothetical protein